MSRPHLPVIVAVLLGTMSMCLAAPLSAADRKLPRVLELTGMSCGEFLQNLEKRSVKDAGVLLTWLDGYRSGFSGTRRMDLNAMEKFSTDLMARCHSKPSIPVLDAIEEANLPE